MPVPTLKTSADLMLKHWDEKIFPRLVYVETTNFCNAKCKYCLYERMERPVEYMSVEDFKRVVAKVKERNLIIGAMFCFGEPLADGTLFEKIRYGRSQKIFRVNHTGINTNCTYLTPEKYDDILSTTTNMTLSFVNTEERFEEITGLDWELCYNNAINFIKYRDKVKAKFKIAIGCNDVNGHERSRVQQAFRGYRVAWARDAEIKWGAKCITGVIDRSIMYHNWTCDGYKGAIQVKPNGDLLFCAYDVLRNETLYANIYTDTWRDIEAKFKARWREPSSLCLRCDFWWNYKQVVANGFRRSPQIDLSWMEAYMSKKEMKAFWDEQHFNKNKRYLTGSRGRNIWAFLNITPMPDSRVLNIGVGTGRCTRDLFEMGCKVDALDISEQALEAVKDIATIYFDHSKLPESEYDLAICNLVAQHMTDYDLIEMLKDVLKSLRYDGMLAIQYASNTKPREYREDLEAQKQGLVRRTKEQMRRVIQVAGGKIVYHCDTKYFPPHKATDDACWNGMGVVRK